MKEELANRPVQREREGALYEQQTEANRLQIFKSQMDGINKMITGEIGPGISKETYGGFLGFLAEGFGVDPVKDLDLPSEEEFQKFTPEQVDEFIRKQGRRTADLTRIKALSDAAKLERQWKIEDDKIKHERAKELEEIKARGKADAAAAKQGIRKVKSQDSNTIKKFVDDLYTNPITGMAHVPEGISDDEFAEYMQKMPEDRLKLVSKATQIFRDNPDVTHPQAVVQAVIEIAEGGNTQSFLDEQEEAYGKIPKGKGTPGKPSSKKFLKKQKALENREKAKTRGTKPQPKYEAKVMDWRKQKREIVPEPPSSPINVLEKDRKK
jgi:hypothetical protein